jgi:ribosomal protein S18 acetylase RimI-like enzyme
MWLSVWGRNLRAIAFYEKHGFRRVGRQDFRMAGELHCDMVMAAPADLL